MYCKQCGAPSESEVCSNCTAQTQYPAQPQSASANYLQIVKANLHYILAGIAALAFLIGILNVFSVFNVSATVSMGSQSESNYVTVSEAADALDSSDSSAAAIYIGNIIFGLANLAVAAIGALWFLKVFKNMPLYDQFIGSKLKFRPAFMMGGIGAIAVVLQFILYLFCGASESVWGFTYEISFGINWTSWLMFVIFVVIAVFDKFVLEKKEQ